MALGSYDPIIAAASRRFGVPEDRIRAVMNVESGGRRDAVSPKGAAGLMQIMAPTYQDLAKRHGFGPDRFDPTNNIHAGTAYLGEMFDQFGNWDEATMAYNMGPGRMQKVRAGTATVPGETAAYLPKVNAVLSTFGPMGPRDVAKLPAPQAVQNEGGDVAGLIRPQPGQNSGMGALFSAPAQRHGSLSGLLEVDEDNNFYEGLGGIWNAGQTDSQPPRTDPAALPGTTQTDRLGLGSRMNDVIQQLLQPQQRPQMGPGGYMMAGALGAVTPLAATRDRKVGIGELLGALGGGLTRGAMAGEQAQREDLQGQLGNLASAAKLQDYQRDEATHASRAEAARQLAAQLRQSGDPQKVALAAAVERDPSLMDKIVGQQAKAAFPDALNPSDRFKVVGNTLVDVTTQEPVYTGAPTARPQTITTAEGVFLRHPDGTMERVGTAVNGVSVNVGAGGGTPEERQAVARSAGLPAPTTSPYDNPNLSVAGKEKLALALQKQADERFKGNDEAVAKANQANAELQRFAFLNETNDTGGATSSPLISGVRGYFDSEFKEMQSITARLAPTMRQPGSGAVSDYDAKQFERGTVSVENPRATNENIAKGMMVGNQNLIAKAEFERAYFDTHQHLQGADQAWKRYLEANPIFDPEAPAGSMTLNTRRQDWRAFFGGGGKAPEPPQGGAANDPLGLR